jgi:hypothetical protein
MQRPSTYKFKVRSSVGVFEGLVVRDQTPKGHNVVRGTAILGQYGESWAVDSVGLAEVADNRNHFANLAIERLWPPRSAAISGLT